MKVSVVNDYQIAQNVSYKKDIEVNFDEIFTEGFVDEDDLVDSIWEYVFYNADIDFVNMHDLGNIVEDSEERIITNMDEIIAKYSHLISNEKEEEDCCKDSRAYDFNYCPKCGNKLKK